MTRDTKPSRYVTEAARWTAVKCRDPDADGHFFYCVKTTKIYCRPNCKARLARRANVEFVKFAPEAAAAGFRPCKRCKPDTTKFIPEAQQALEDVRQMLEELSHDAPIPSLDTLAAQANLTKYHLHRCFKKAYSYTPREYVLKQREKRLEETRKPLEPNVVLSTIPDFEINDLLSHDFLWDVDLPTVEMFPVILAENTLESFGIPEDLLWPIDDIDPFNLESSS